MSQAQRLGPNPLGHQYSHMAASGNTSVLEEQLLREVACLERQISRLKLRGVDFSILQTYQDMIHSREQMLDSLP